MYRLLLTVSALSCTTFVTPAPADDVSRPKIIGGQAIDSKTEVPWLVLLRGENKQTQCLFTIFGWCPFWHTVTVSTTYCGGSLLDPNHILSAAHCFENERINYVWSVRLGTKKLSAGVGDAIANFFCTIFYNPSCQDHQIAVSKVVVNPSYDASRFAQTSSYDLSVVTLGESAPIYSDVQPILLPLFANASWPVANQSCLIAGWGCDTANGQVMDRSRKINLPIISNNVCKMRWPIANTDFQLCAGEVGHSVGICPGDSGGGLICRGINPNDTSVYVAGIASFTSAEDPGQYPAVFTRVSAHLDFIRSCLR